MSNEYNRDIYFATESAMSPQFAGGVFDKMREWTDWVETSGLDTAWMTNEALYQGVDPRNYNGFFDKASFQIMGKNGELLYVSFNEARNLMQHILNMTVSQPPNMTAKAINGDDASLIAAQTFDGVFDFYFNTHNSGRLLKQSAQAVERCLYGDIGYMLCEWNPLGGARIMPEMAPDGSPPGSMGDMKYEGDLYFKCRGARDVMFDPGVEDEDEQDWKCIRDQVNKWELAERFKNVPGAYDKIIATSAAAQEVLSNRRGWRRPLASDMIDIYKFYARPSKVLRNGRRAILLDADTVLLDEDNPYGEIPVFSVKAMDRIGSAFGYAPMNVVAPVQLSEDVLTSAIMTNFAMFGVQNIAVKGSDQFDVETLAGAMNIIKYNEQVPVPLQLADQAQGIVEFHEALRHIGETLSGINSVVRGDPDASLKSGKALGIVQAQAVQFQSHLAASYARFLQNIGNFMLKVFRLYATTDRIVQIVGKDQTMQSKTWNRDTFGPIERVTAELVDPAMRTLGYKTDLAMFMAQQQMTNTPQEFLTVLTTGQLKPMIKAPLTEINLMHQENQDILEAAEKLAQVMKQSNLAQPTPEMIQAVMPPVLRTDNDDLHIAEHSGLMSTPATRRDSLVTLIGLAHITAHEQNRVVKAQKQLLDQMAVQSVIPQPIGMPTQGAAGANGAQGSAAEPGGQAASPTPQPIQGQSGMPQPAAA